MLLYGISSCSLCHRNRVPQRMMDTEIPIISTHLDEMQLERMFVDRKTDEESSKKTPTKFGLKLAMRNFRPEDIKVRVESGNVIVELDEKRKRKNTDAIPTLFVK